MLWAFESVFTSYYQFRYLWEKLKMLKKGVISDCTAHGWGTLTLHVLDTYNINTNNEKNEYVQGCKQVSSGPSSWWILNRNS